MIQKFAVSFEVFPITKRSEAPAGQPAPPPAPSAVARFDLSDAAQVSLAGAPCADLAKWHFTI